MTPPRSRLAAFLALAFWLYPGLAWSQISQISDWGTRPDPSSAPVPNVVKDAPQPKPGDPVAAMQATMQKMQEMQGKAQAQFDAISQAMDGQSTGGSSGGSGRRMRTSPAKKSSYGPQPRARTFGITRPKLDRPKSLRR